MRKSRMTVIITIVLMVVVLGGIALRLSVPYLSKDSAAAGITLKDDKSVLGDCPDTPNCQGSEASRSNQSVDRFELTKASDLAITTLAEIVLSQPHTRIVEQDLRYLHATFSSRIMGFTDDVEFLLSDDQKSIQIRSASRLGKSDLGANLKRIVHLRSLAEGRI